MAEYRPVNPSDQHGKVPTDAHRAHTMSKKGTGRLHWQAPTTMISSLLLGLLFAIGHDRYYHHYDRREVESSLEQTVIVNVGTAFAFMVKMFFAISTATVFSQQIWLSLRCRAESINDIDTLFDILKNVLYFMKINLWTRHWVLAIIALITWCLPLAAVFTPGTIHVQPDLIYRNDTLLQPPQPQQAWYGTQKYAAVEPDYTAVRSVGNITSANVVNLGPSSELYSFALRSVSQRDVLSIPHPNSNSSYELSFFGPSLSCNSLSAEDFSTFNTSLTEAYNALSLPGMHSFLGGVKALRKEVTVKYNAWVGTNGGYGTSYNLSNPYWNNDTGVQNTPSSANIIYFYLSSTRQQDDGSVLVACHLHNATYNVGFSFENSQQVIDVRSVTIKEAVPYNATVDIERPNYSNIVYNSVLYAFNNIVVAAATNDSMANVLYYGGPVSVSALRDFIEGEPSTKLTSDAVITTLEEMFQNITISTMSSPSLRLPDSQAKGIKGKTWYTVNIYVCEPTNLYIAYGCAFLASSLCVLWGLHLLLHRNRVSYSVCFSTILRTTRRSEMDGIVNADARVGNDPVPKAMEGVRLRYLVGERRSGGEGFALVHDENEMDVLSGEGTQ